MIKSQKILKTKGNMDGNSEYKFLHVKNAKTRYAGYP